MICRLLLITAAVLWAPTDTRAGDLTAAEVRFLLAKAGVNPGTTHDLGAPHGRKAIQKITVRTGKGREHYVIDLWVASPSVRP